MNRKAKLISTLILGGGVACLVLILPIVAHYHAKGHLATFKAQLRKQGERLRISELKSALSADDLNGADALMTAANRLRPSSPSSNTPPLMRRTSAGRALVAWKQENLSNGEVSNVWASLSRSLADTWEPLQEIAELLEGNSLGFNLSYEQGFSLMLPQLTRLKGAAQWLSAVAVLELHEGRTSNAWQTIGALTALVERNKNESLMICELVRIAISSIAVATTWEALQANGWRDQELKELQGAWASVDFLSQTEAALAMERAMGEKTFEVGRGSYAMISAGFSGASAASSLAELKQLGQDVIDNPKEGLRNMARRYPGYWHWKWWQSYDDELANAEIIQASLEAVRAAKKERFFWPALQELEKSAVRVRKAHPRAGQWLGYSWADDGMITRFFARVLRIEIERSLLVMAIALKRYELKHGVWPARLSGLAPDFAEALLRDPVDGKPLRYRRQADGTFLLYSVGEDGQDNGGDATPAVSASRHWTRARDAAWPQPAAEAEAKLEVEKLAAEWRKAAEQAARTTSNLTSVELEFRKRYGLELPASSQPNTSTNAP